MRLTDHDEPRSVTAGEAAWLFGVPAATVMQSVASDGTFDVMGYFMASGTGMVLAFSKPQGKWIRINKKYVWQNPSVYPRWAKDFREGKSSGERT